MTYDDWKLATPPEYDDGADHSSENEPDFCYECQRDLDDCACDDHGPERYEDEQRSGCVLGAACLAVDPFHTSAECFDAEMAEAYMAPDHEGGDRP